MKESYERAMAGGMAGAEQVKTPTVTDQLRDCRDSLVKLNARMEHLIDRTGVNVVNTIAGAAAPDRPQADDTRSVVLDISELCSRVHRKMDTLDSIA